MPRLVCGLAGLTNFNPIYEECERATSSCQGHAAAGICEFDMGDIYPGIEEQAGQWLRRHFAADGASRASVKLLTKFVPDKKMLGSIDADYVRRIVQRSCNRLGVDCVDRVQLHWWDYGAAGLLAAAQALVALQQEGLLKEIGLTNTDTAHLRQLVEAGVPIVSNQVQYSLIDRRAEAEMVPYMQQTNGGIELIAYGVLGGGFLSDKWLNKDEPDPTSANVPPSSRKYFAMIGESGGWAAFQAVLQACRAVADELSTAMSQPVSIAQVALAWVLTQPVVGGAIVGGGSANHVDSTLASANAIAPALTAAHQQLLGQASVGAGGAVPAGDCYTIERDASTPSGAALAPWTDVGSLAKPPHFEELKRRTVETLRAVEPGMAALLPLPSTGTDLPAALGTVALPGVAGTTATFERLLCELTENFPEGSEARTALSEEQMAEQGAFQLQLSLLASQAAALDGALAVEGTTAASLLGDTPRNAALRFGTQGVFRLKQAL